jgi:hypothetical protein
VHHLDTRAGSPIDAGRRIGDISTSPCVTGSADPIAQPWPSLQI